MEYVGYRGSKLHAAMLQAFGLEEGHGSLAAVARCLGTTRQWYTTAVRGNNAVSLSQVAKWCTKAGVGLEMFDGEVRFLIKRHPVAVPDAFTAEFTTEDGVTFALTYAAEAG